eukprot:3763447-Rhodomonas_salina.1
MRVREKLADKRTGCSNTNQTTVMVLRVSCWARVDDEGGSSDIPRLAILLGPCAAYQRVPPIRVACPPADGFVPGMRRLEYESRKVGARTQLKMQWVLNTKQCVRTNPSLAARRGRSREKFAL